jgi:hypothetical protein
MPTPKAVTNEQVNEALRSLDESINKLEKVVLPPGKSQNETNQKTRISNLLYRMASPSVEDFEL